MGLMTLLSYLRDTEPTKIKSSDWLSVVTGTSPFVPEADTWLLTAASYFRLLFQRCQDGGRSAQQ